MRTDQSSMLESLRLIEAFLDQHADKLGGIGQTGAKKRLADAITALDDYAATNIGGIIQAKDLTQKQQGQRVALIRDHMASIAKIAKADLPHVPEVSDLRMPRSRVTGARLAAAAVRMAKAAELHAPVFVAAGLSDDFVGQLSSAAEDLVGTVNQRTTTRSLARGAAQGLKTRMTEGRRVVGILNTFVKKALKDDPALLKDWTILKRVPRTARTTTATTPVNATTPASAASTSTTPTTTPSTSATTALPTTAPATAA